MPIYQYLDSLDIDEAGYTLRTASLMSQPEYQFDAANASDYSLFGIRYLVLPASHAAPSLPLGRLPVLLLRNRLLQVYELPASSYFQVADTTGTITANRADIGSQTLPYLRSALPGQRRYLAVAYAGAAAAPPTLPGGARRPAGRGVHRRAVGQLQVPFLGCWALLLGVLPDFLLPSVVGTCKKILQSAHHMSKI